MRKKISRNSNIHERIYQVPQEENQMHDQIHKIENQNRSFIYKQINQLHFLSYWDQIKSIKNTNLIKNISHSQVGIEIQKDQKQNFSNQQRQSLKNAFRYICRLVFKEAVHYYDVIQKTNFSQYQSNLKFNKKKGKEIQINTKETQMNSKFKENHINSEFKGFKRNPFNSQFKESNINSSFKYGYLFQQAQQISGERYFKEFLQRIQNIEKIIVLKYMIWFLKTKYLRYINKSINQNKGKRKEMKKDLYIRFKNNVMLPYLHQVLRQAQAQSISLQKKQ